MAKKNYKDTLVRGFEAIKTPTFNMGFSKLNLYVSTGNYALNRRLSNRFDRGYRFGRSVIIGGEPGSGKSLHTAYVCANAQREHNALIIWVDIEKASDDGDGAWLARAGIDLNNLVYMRAGTVSDCKEILAKMTGIARAARNDQRDKEIARQTAKAKGKNKKGYDPIGEVAEIIADDDEQMQPIVIVFDSYSALLTDSAYKHAVEGDNTGDQGQQAKQIGAFIQSTTHLVDDLPILLIGMVHIYTNQADFGDRQQLTGGVKAQFMASYILKMNLHQLKAEELGKGKTADEKKKVVGITSNVEIKKSRFSKPFEKVPILIPYETGMDKYSGLFEVLRQEGVVYNPINPETGKPNIQWYAYKDATNKEIKFQRPGFVRDGHADTLVKIAPIEPTRADNDNETETLEVLEVEL